MSAPLLRRHRRAILRKHCRWRLCRLFRPSRNADKRTSSSPTPQPFLPYRRSRSIHQRHRHCQAVRESASTLGVHPASSQLRLRRDYRRLSQSRFRRYLSTATGLHLQVRRTRRRLPSLGAIGKHPLLEVDGIGKRQSPRRPRRSVGRHQALVRRTTTSSVTSPPRTFRIFLPAPRRRQSTSSCVDHPLGRTSRPCEHHPGRCRATASRRYSVPSRRARGRERSR